VPKTPPLRVNREKRPTRRELEKARSPSCRSKSLAVARALHLARKIRRGPPASIVKTRECILASPRSLCASTVGPNLSETPASHPNTISANFPRSPKMVLTVFPELASSLRVPSGTLTVSSELGSRVPPRMDGSCAPDNSSQSSVRPPGCHFSSLNLRRHRTSAAALSSGNCRRTHVLKLLALLSEIP
jgi:hypothetical protein